MFIFMSKKFSRVGIFPGLNTITPKPHFLIFLATVSLASYPTVSVAKFVSFRLMLHAYLQMYPTV